MIVVVKRWWSCRPESLRWRIDWTVAISVPTSAKTSSFASRSASLHWCAGSSEKPGCSVLHEATARSVTVCIASTLPFLAESLRILWSLPTFQSYFYFSNFFYSDRFRHVSVMCILSICTISCVDRKNAHNISTTARFVSVCFSLPVCYCYDVWHSG